MNPLTYFIGNEQKKQQKNKKKTKWVWSCGKIWAKLGQMLSKKVKKLELSIGFSHILHGEYILKQKVVIVQTPEWEFKANIPKKYHISRTLGPNFCPNWVRNGKN